MGNERGTCRGRRGDQIFLVNHVTLNRVPAAPLVGAQVDDLDDEERAELHEAIREGFEDAKAGRTVPAEQWLAELRSRL
jgi:hypothetical protein